MGNEYFVLSNFGVRYFLADYVDSNTVPGSGETELEHIISCNLGAFTKDTKRYKTLNGDGWDNVATLGQSQDDVTFEALRVGDGDAYEGTAGDSTYTIVRDWFMRSTSSGGSKSPKAIVEVLPRGDNEYEGTCYYVIPSTWGPGTRNTEDGQEYSFDVIPFGPPVPLKVVYTKADGEVPESWTFTKAGA